MNFEFATAPKIIFGEGTLQKVGELASSLGNRALLMVGGQSADQSGLLERMRHMTNIVEVARCTQEPMVEDIDHTVALARSAQCDFVIAIGGGSVLDCGKAVAAMMTNPGSLVEYLEGVGTGRVIQAAPIPLIAIPTTAGTGSEVTKNAVIRGPGFKKSLRSSLLIPRVALVDPLLTHSTSTAVTAACGMDALTQLIEAYVSRQASPICDALALHGVGEVGRTLEWAYLQPHDSGARQGMSLAALLSGICLANAGLGAVHGLCSPLGAMFPIPHGAACAALLPHTIEANLKASQGTKHEERVWSRYAQLAEYFTAQDYNEVATAACALWQTIAELQQRLHIVPLSHFGITAGDIPRIIEGARGGSMKTNPIDLDDGQLRAILEKAI